jgi:hypothetical protein
MLRARRAGQGPGRIYTLAYEGTDQTGNRGTCSVIVEVPHDQRGKAGASR